MKKQPLILSGYGLHGFACVFKKFIAAPQQSNYSCNYIIIINAGVGFMSRAGKKIIAAFDCWYCMWYYNNKGDRDEPVRKIIDKNQEQS